MYQKRHFLFSFVILFAGLISQYVHAQADNSRSGWGWSGHIDHVNFDKEAASEEWIEDSAVAFGFAGEYYSDTSEMTFSLGMNYFLYDDNAAFGQYVENWDDDIDYEESDASALSVFAEFGPKYHFGANNLSFVVIRGGVSTMLFSERSISGCSDCYSEDIDIDGGLYGVLGIGQSFGPVDIGLQFHQYFSGDIDNSLRFKVAVVF